MHIRPLAMKHVVILVLCVVLSFARERQTHPVGTLPVCEVKLNETSAKYLQKSFIANQPSFAILKLHFRGQHVQFTNDVILPFHWVWTYYDNHNLASYLKWPNDFPILSFGLLDANTLPDGHFIELEIPDSSKCYLKIGEMNSTLSIAKALKTLTQDYLQVSKDEDDVDYSYWCYLAEVPNRKNTMSYKLRAYTSYPAEMMRYRCCHTYSDLHNQSVLHVNCSNKQIRQSIESSLMPFFISIVAFVFFPIFLLNASSACVNTNSKERTLYSRLEDIVNEYDEDYIYLDGTPPISFTTLISGCCGLANKFPMVVSRFRRFLFLLFAPSIVFVKIYVYNEYMHDMIMALLKHDCPVGFVAMIGGFEKSKQVFLTAFGGPYIVLCAFYVAGIFFIILPNNLAEIFDTGSSFRFEQLRYTTLSLGLKSIERYSFSKISNKQGYAKAASLCTAGVFMVLNPSFWCFVLHCQYRRLVLIRTSLCHHLNQWVGWVFFIIILPFVVVLGVCEGVLLLIVYGFPIIAFIKIYVRGLTISLMRLFSTNYLMTRLGKWKRLFIALLVGVSFALYVFSFCTIFTETFVYIAKTIFFSFLSVIVYPSTSFGYLFFGIVLLFYIVKSVAGFGDVYLQLLANAVDICTQLDEDPSRVHFVDDLLLVDGTKTKSINKVQIQGTVIELSYDQRKKIREYNSETRPRLRYKEHMLGIPKDLFDQLVREYRPVHKQIIITCIRVFLIVLLIIVTFSIISHKPLGSNKDISEVMHVVFLMAVGALPKILEIALENRNHSVIREIQSRTMKSDIVKYFQQKSNVTEDNTA